MMTRRQINKTIKGWYNTTRNSQIQVIFYHPDGMVMDIFEFGRNMFTSDGRQSAWLKRNLDNLLQADTFDLVEIPLRPSKMKGDEELINIYGEKLQK